MKNNILIILIIFCYLFFLNKTFGKEIEFDASDIEIINNLNRPINYLEGFLSEYSSSGVLLNEKRVVLLYSYEPALQTGFSTTKTVKFDLGEEKPSNFEFNISKVKFFGESRVFAWHKKVGFIRID